MLAGSKLDHKAFTKHGTPLHLQGPEHRKHLRFTCFWKIKFCDLENTANRLHIGKCRDLSQGGMKLNAFHPLVRNSVILIQMNPDLFSVHIKLPLILRASKDQILAQVIWRHLNLDTGIFETGIRFFEERDRKHYQGYLDQAADI